MRLPSLKYTFRAIWPLPAPSSEPAVESNLIASLDRLDRAVETRKVRATHSLGDAMKQMFPEGDK